MSDAEEDSLHHVMFVGGPLDGTWGCMGKELDWPEQKGEYKLTDQYDRDGLRIFQWEPYD